MYICHFASKIEYSKHKIDFFYNIKNSDLKINMPENHKSLSISFFFFKEKKRKKNRSGRVTCPSK